VYATLLSILFSFCIVLTGYFSRNKYAMLASIRTVLLVLNLEVFLGLMILNLVLITESFTFSVFVVYQESVWLVFLYFGLIGVILITFLLEVNRAPFDLPEAEAELVSGYNTEYAAMGFALFFLGEYANMILMCSVLSILFLGGWLPLINFFPFNLIPGVFWFGFKVTILLFVFVWVRAAFPRYRYDQLMRLGWKVFLPFSLAWVLFVSGIFIGLDWLV
jgi:NADH-quinone oxidoreductase subunit H